jgi:hypothetical protein
MTNRRICDATGCDEPHFGRGWCSKHYMRWMRTGDTEARIKPRGTPEQRFWAKVTKLDSCWIWRGALSNGYGVFTIRKGKTVKAHRFVYEELVGPIPAGMQLDHLCRNRACVNPAHLEVVTHQENLRRGEIGSHWAVRTHCGYGHPYDEANTIVRAKGTRVCRECGRRRMREYRERQRKPEDGTFSPS